MKEKITEKTERGQIEIDITDHDILVSHSYSGYKMGMRFFYKEISALFTAIDRLKEMLKGKGE